MWTTRFGTKHMPSLALMFRWGRGTSYPWICDLRTEIELTGSETGRGTLLHRPLETTHHIVSSGHSSTYNYQLPRVPSDFPTNPSLIRSRRRNYSDAACLFLNKYTARQPTHLVSSISVTSRRMTYQTITTSSPSGSPSPSTSPSSTSSPETPPTCLDPSIMTSRAESSQSARSTPSHSSIDLPRTQTASKGGCW